MGSTISYLGLVLIFYKMFMSISKMSYIKKLSICMLLLTNTYNDIALSDEIADNKIQQIVAQEIEKYKKEQLAEKNDDNVRQQKAQKNIDDILNQEYERNELNIRKRGWSIKMAPIFGYKNTNQATLGLNFNIYYNFDKNTSIFFGLDCRWHDLIRKGAYVNGITSGKNKNTANISFRSRWDAFLKLGFQYRFDNDIFMAYYTILGAGQSNYKTTDTAYKFNEVKVKWGLGGEFGYKRIFIRGDFDMYVQSYKMLQYRALCFEGTIGVGFYFL